MLACMLKVAASNELLVQCNKIRNKRDFTSETNFKFILYFFFITLFLTFFFSFCVLFTTTYKYYNCSVFFHWMAIAHPIPFDWLLLLLFNRSRKWSSNNACDRIQKNRENTKADKIKFPIDSHLFFSFNFIFFSPQLLDRT